MPDIVATLVILYKPSLDADWQEKQAIKLDLPTIRIGRFPDCEVVLDVRRLSGDNTKKSFVSRRHATMFKWEENVDYEIMDGIPGQATIAEPDPAPILSACGVEVNGTKLEPGERRLLRDRDEIVIVPNQIKLVYSRPQNQLKDNLEDLTYVPPEYFTEQSAQ